jgi:hypothetical protein
VLLGLPASQPGLLFFPIGGGPTHRLPPPQVSLRWSGDGKHLFVESRGSTFSVPLPPGRLLPERFAQGFPLHEDLTKLVGARLIPEIEVAPGPTADVYAFTRRGAQRNLYRIPTP